MLRSYGKGMLVAALVWPSLGWAQQPRSAPTPALTSEQFITLQEPGKPEQKCRVLRTWQEKGSLVKEVLDLNTGEVLRVVEGGPVGGHPLVKPAPRFPGSVSRLFHLNKSVPTPGTPNRGPTGVIHADYQSTSASPSGVRPVGLPAASGLVPISAAEEKIKVREPGKPVQKCRVVTSWRTPEGYLARQAQDVITGETLTIVEAPLSGGGPSLAPRNAVASRIYHWTNQTPPPGAPVPPAVVDAGPVTSVVDPSPGGNAAPPPGPDNCTAAAAPCPTCDCAAATAPCVPGPCPPCTTPASCSGADEPVVVSTSPARGWFANRFWNKKAESCEPNPCPPCTTPAPADNDAVAAGPCPTGDCAAATAPGPSDPCPSCPTTVAVPPAGEAAAPVVVNEAPARSGWFANRVPLWKRMFGSKEVVMENGPDTAPANSIAAASPSPYAAPPYAASKYSRSFAEPAKPTDWRKSWGKPDTSQALAENKQAPAVPVWPKDFDRERKPAPAGSVLAPKEPAQPPLAAAKPAVHPAVPRTAAAEPVVHPAAPQTAAAKYADLARAARRKADPLNDPARYSTRPEIKNPNPGAVAEATKEVESKYGKAPGPKPAAPIAKEQPKLAEKSKAPAALGKATTHARAPLGTKSILAAYDGKPTGPVCFLPVPMVTLPQRIPPAPPGLASSVDAGKAQAAKEDESQINAFTPPGYGGGTANGGESPMGNAFTGGTMPASKPPGYVMRPDFITYRGMSRPPMMSGPMPVSPAGYLPPAARPAAPSVPVAGPQAQLPAPTPQQLVATLQNGLYPSQRERAAMALAALDSKANPEVVNVLLLAAREDPAATVRSACVRCLGKMNVNTPGVTTALQALRDDAHPLVRQAANEVLGTEGASRSDPSKVQPASAVAPAGAK